MTRICRACLRETTDGAYHARCLQRLFATDRCPGVDLDAKGVEKAIASQAGKISISGVQEKVMMDLTPDRLSLRAVDSGGAYILKPQERAFRHLPENEHLTMCLAELSGLIVPAIGLVALKDGSAAYIVKRFDRTDANPPGKLRQEDFCSLLRRDPEEKYEATAEDCAGVVQQFASDPEESLRRLYQLFAFSFWVSNGDLHLKNLSLLAPQKSDYRLSPAYDLLSTRLYPQLGQEEALSLNGKKAQLTRRDFLAFGHRCGIAATEAASIIDAMLDRREAALEMVGRSLLPRDSQRLYRKWLDKKGKWLSLSRSAPGAA
jgi:serine/threonine-protein kinase HipA